MPCHPSMKSWGVFDWIWCGCVDTTRHLAGAGKFAGVIAFCRAVGLADGWSNGFDSSLAQGFGAELT